MNRFTTLLVCGLLAAAHDAGAQERIDVQSLKGIKALRVVVEPLKADIEKEGLTAAQIRTDVETRLKQASVPVIATENPESLYIYVHTVYMPNEKLYLFNVDIGLRQDVLIAHQPPVAMGNIPTWSSGTLGADDRTAIAAHVRDIVRTKVDEFIKAFQTANPKP